MVTASAIKLHTQTKLLIFDTLNENSGEMRLNTYAYAYESQKEQSQTIQWDEYIPVPNQLVEKSWA